ERIPAPAGIVNLRYKSCLEMAGQEQLFRWLPHDYYRKVSTMNTPKLTMKIVGYGVKAKVIFDLLTTENGTS
ncbi:hypothetical protein V6282_26300, partial [Enterobacter mori]